MVSCHEYNPFLGSEDCLALNIEASSKAVHNFDNLSYEN